MNKTTTFLSLAALALVVGAVMTTTLTNAAETDTNAAGVQSSPRAEGNGFARARGKHHESFAALRAAVEANVVTANNNEFVGFETEDCDKDGICVVEANVVTANNNEFVGFETEDCDKDGICVIGATVVTANNNEFVGFETEDCDKDGICVVEANVVTAIAANDYSAFQTAIANDATGPLASIDTAEEFAKHVKMHSLLDEAKAIGEELGLPGPREGMGGMGGMGKGFGKMMK